MLEVIQSHLDIARRDARRSAKVLKSLAACSKASTHARGITKQVLAFSTDSGSERHVAELSQVVREAVDLARVTLRGAHELHYPEVEGDIPVSMNVPQMQQAIISLLLTATRSLGALGGEIGIYVDSVTLSDPGFASLGSTSGPTLARIGIEARMTETTGDGRSEGSESATFTTARRAATETEIDFSRRIIAAHEGATVLNQESDATLRVSVYLPIASSVHEEGSLRATRPSPRPADGRGASRGTGRAIMYVDDHKWLLPLVERLLADSEYEVRGFIDPRAAIDALHRRPEDYALVATDYKMAKVSGLDIARAAKAAQPDLPVVIISAYLTNDLLAQSLRAGADEVLSKSSITRELVPTVERLLRPKLEVAGSRR
jgi:CheY-like chemotaxis protein